VPVVENGQCFPFLRCTSSVDFVRKPQWRPRKRISSRQFMLLALAVWATPAFHPFDAMAQDRESSHADEYITLYGDSTIQDSDLYFAALDYLQTSYRNSTSMRIDLKEFPNRTRFQWRWPSSGCGEGGAVCAYPHVAYGLAAEQISALHTYTVSFAYSRGFGQNDDVLLDEFLSASPTGSPNDFEIEGYAAAPPNGFGRTVGIPLSHHMTLPFSADVYSPTTSSPPQIEIFPTGTFTNAFPNGAMSGALAGTPGVDPTYCQFTDHGATGLTKTIVGSGSTTANDGVTINYVDVRLYGTSTGSGTWALLFGPNPNGLPAAIMSTSYPNRWWIQPYIAFVAGSIANINFIQVGAYGWSSRGDYVESPAGANLANYLTSTPQRFGFAYAPSAATAAVSGAVGLNVSRGEAVDMTLRVGVGQTGGETGLMGYDPSEVVTAATWDVKAIYADLIAAGLITSAQYVIGHQMGAEIMGGDGYLDFQNFVATWD
jgi:hypothetical protein